MTAVPMPLVVLSPDWTVLDQQWSRTMVRLRLGTPDDRAAEVILTRSVATALRHAYPVSAHDVRVDVVAPELPATDITRLLRDVVASVESGDPRCRRLVLAIEASDLSSMAAAELAGFRFVVEVDVDEGEVALLVAEPDWVTRVDMDLDRVPGS